MDTSNYKKLKIDSIKRIPTRTEKLETNATLHTIKNIKIYKETMLPRDRSSSKSIQEKTKTEIR